MVPCACWTSFSRVMRIHVDSVSQKSRGTRGVPEEMCRVDTLSDHCRAIAPTTCSRGRTHTRYTLAHPQACPNEKIIRRMDGQALAGGYLFILPTCPKPRTIVRAESMKHYTTTHFNYRHRNYLFWSSIYQ